MNQHIPHCPTTTNVWLPSIADRYAELLTTKVLEAYKAGMRGFPEDKMTRDQLLPLVKETIRTDGAGALENLAEKLASQAAERTGAPRDTIDERIRGALRAILNDSPWHPVSAKVRLPHDPGLSDEYGSLARTFFDRALPLNHHFAERFRFADSFRAHDIGGRSSFALSHHYEAPRLGLANAWLSTLEKEGGTIAFEALRSATPVEYGSYPSERANQLSESNMLELLRAAAAINLAQRTEHERNEILSGKTALTLKLVSFDLQSFGSSDEASRLESDFVQAGQQLKTWLSSISTVDLNISDQRIPIRTEVTVKSFEIPTDLSTSRKSSQWSLDTTNRIVAGLARLIFEASPIMESRNTERSLRTKLDLLTSELGSLIATDEFKGLSADPYRIVGLTANLAYLLGYTVHLHSRDGIDRTGLADAESKLIAGLLDTARLPERGSDLQPFERSFLRELLLHGTALPIAERNRGVPLLSIEPGSHFAVNDPYLKRIGLETWEQVTKTGYRPAATEFRPCGRR